MAKTTACTRMSSQSSLPSLLSCPALKIPFLRFSVLLSKLCFCPPIYSPQVGVLLDEAEQDHYIGCPLLSLGKRWWRPRDRSGGGASVPDPPKIDAAMPADAAKNADLGRTGRQPLAGRSGELFGRLEEWGIAAWREQVLGKRSPLSTEFWRPWRRGVHQRVRHGRRGRS